MGATPEDFTQADLVILGVSRSSKTPLSIFLAQQGLKVANIPLDPTTEVPKEIYDVDPTRIFGLMTTPEVLSDIRIRRLGNARGVAAEYADLEYIYHRSGERPGAYAQAGLHRCAYREKGGRGNRSGDFALLRTVPPVPNWYH